jgi:hypothetical protein
MSKALAPTPVAVAQHPVEKEFKKSSFTKINLCISLLITSI